MWRWWLAWVVFVVYGSLVPLDFHPIAWADAWSQLRHAPMLQLGIESRADWVANGVLYLPVGFLGLVAWAPGPSGVPRRLFALVASVIIGCVLAGAVEMAQTAFPPRTVSRNDLLAEGLGTLLGAIAALLDGGRLQRLLQGWALGGPVLARRMAWAYALLFPVLALFPFDLLLDAAEWHEKLIGPLVGWWLAPSSFELGSLRVVAKLLVETAAVAPLGALWALSRAPGQARVPGSGAGWGLGLGLAIELAQLAFASGQSQGLSVLTRMAGFVLGARLARWQQTVTTESIRALVRRASLGVLVLQVAGVLLLSGVWRGPWLSAEEAWRRLANEVRFLPFYYHYFTTEMHALSSLVAVGVSHAPLGLLGWAWHARPLATMLMAGLFAAAIETAKLWAADIHPDPTNVLIAAAAAGLAQAIASRLFAAAGPAGRQAAPLHRPPR